MNIAVTAENLHPTSEMALEALQWLDENREEGFKNVLDMGCGNGILSVMAAALWDSRVLAVDIAPKAVQDTLDSAAAHGVEGRVTARQSDGFLHPMVDERAPYDLIFFNLLAEPIVRMAPQVKSHLKPGGICLIGGILSWKAEATEAVYKDIGFEIIRQIVRSPWHLYIMLLSEP